MRLSSGAPALVAASLLFACNADEAPSSTSSTSSGGSSTSASGGAGGGGVGQGGGAGQGGATSAGGAGQGGATSAGGAGQGGGAGGSAQVSAFEYAVWRDVPSANVDLAGSWAHEGSMTLDSGDCPFTYFEPPAEDSLDVTWDAAQKLLIVRPNVGATTVGFQIHDPGGPAQTIAVDGIACKNLDGSIQYSLTGGSLATDHVTLDTFDPGAHALRITFTLDGKAANVSAIHVAGFIEAHAK